MVTRRSKQRRRFWWWFGGLGASAVVVIVAAQALVARSADDPADRQPAVAPPPAPAAAAGVPLAVPDVRLRAADFAGGREFVLSQHAGKPAILYFMASWCLTCIPEAKALVQLALELGDSVTIVVLDTDPDDTEAMLERFAAVVGGHPGVWALDTGNAVTRAYNVRSLDTTVIVAGGREVSRTFSPQSLAQLRAAVQKARQTGQ